MQMRKATCDSVSSRPIRVQQNRAASRLRESRTALDEARTAAEPGGYLAGPKSACADGIAAFISSRV